MNPYDGSSYAQVSTGNVVDHKAMIDAVNRALQRLETHVHGTLERRLQTLESNPPKLSEAREEARDRVNLIGVYEKANVELHNKVRELQAKVAELATENERLNGLLKIARDGLRDLRESFE